MKKRRKVVFYKGVLCKRYGLGQVTYFSGYNAKLLLSIIFYNKWNCNQISHLSINIEFIMLDGNWIYLLIKFARFSIIVISYSIVFSYLSDKYVLILNILIYRYLNFYLWDHHLKKHSSIKSLCSSIIALII